ncbi:MAG TPA: protein phosphatase 2C domain-containing protein [Bryobacteraceae bacterium]|jgi:serine/threonine protein phosphatase PrpC|nr:protein phosphatase 2C domain-containing protein [Bryobacteraceae bacterium]
MRFLPGNAQHIGARHSQQDSFGFADPNDREFIAHGGFLAVVCDGMGGMEYGDAASRTAVRAFLDAYQRKTPAESIPDALERSVRDANSHVVALAHSLGMSEGIGTTLVAVAMHEQSLYYISVGDSGIFLCSRGQVRMLNSPHIFANVLDAAVARGSLSREDADHHPERESLTSFIGAEKLEEIDRNVDPLPLEPGDTVLLASDGMFKTLNPQEIQASLQGSPEGWPEALVERTIAKKREYQDNVTVVSVTLEIEDQAAALPRTVILKPAEPAAPVEPPAPIPPPAWTPPAQSAPPAHGSRSLWPIVLIVLVLAAGAAGWWYLGRHRSGALIDSTPVSDPARGRPAPSVLPPDKPDPSARPATGTVPPIGSSTPVQTPTPAPSPSPKPGDKQ